MNSPFPSPEWRACFQARRADRLVGKVLRTLPFLAVDAVSELFARGRFQGQMTLTEALKRARLGARRGARYVARRGGSVRPVWTVRAPFVRIDVWAGHEPAQTWVEIAPDL